LLCPRFQRFIYTASFRAIALKAYFVDSKLPVRLLSLYSPPSLSRTFWLEVSASVLVAFYSIFKLLCKAPHHPSVDSRYPLLSTHALRSSQFDVIALIHFVLPVYSFSLVGFSLLLSYPLL
jgi:hypothetical protein